MFRLISFFLLIFSPRSMPLPVFRNGASFYLVIKNLNCHKFLLFNMLHIKFTQILPVQHAKISVINLLSFSKALFLVLLFLVFFISAVSFSQTSSPFCRASSKSPNQVIFLVSTFLFMQHSSTWFSSSFYLPAR